MRADARQLRRRRRRDRARRLAGAAGAPPAGRRRRDDHPVLLPDRAGRRLGRCRPRCDRASATATGYRISGSEACSSRTGRWATCSPSGPAPTPASRRSWSRASAEGMTVVRDEDLLGLRGVPATELLFDDTPGELLGTDGEGFRLAMVTLDDARLNISACALGTARGARDRARTCPHARGVRSADHPPPGPRRSCSPTWSPSSLPPARCGSGDAARSRRGEGRMASTMCAMAKNACVHGRDARDHRGRAGARRRWD